MTDIAAEDAAAAAEFRRLARYLLGAEATPYQTKTYLALRRRHALAPKSRFDRVLLAFASNGIGLALADAYSGLFARKSALRARLVAALAVLETSAPSFRAVDAPDPGGLLAYVFVALHGAAACFALLCAAVLLVPAQIWCAATESRR